MKEGTLVLKQFIIFSTFTASFKNDKLMPSCFRNYVPFFVPKGKRKEGSFLIKLPPGKAHIDVWAFPGNPGWCFCSAD